MSLCDPVYDEIRVTYTGNCSISIASTTATPKGHRGTRHGDPSSYMAFSRDAIMKPIEFHLFYFPFCSCTWLRLWIFQREQINDQPFVRRQYRRIFQKYIFDDMSASVSEWIVTMPDDLIRSRGRSFWLILLLKHTTPAAVRHRGTVCVRKIRYAPGVNPLIQESEKGAPKKQGLWAGSARQSKTFKYLTVLS